MVRFFSEKLKYLVKNKRQIRAWIAEIIADNIKIAGEINYILTTDEVLNEINIKYLNTDTYTDIITFNLSEEENIVSGDIYISIDRVTENAEKFQVDIEVELKRVLVHGVLHLMGYNDGSSAEKRKMTNLENKYIEKYMC